MFSPRYYVIDILILVLDRLIAITKATQKCVSEHVCMLCTYSHRKNVAMVKMIDRIHARFSLPYAYKLMQDEVEVCTYS